MGNKQTEKSNTEPSLLMFLCKSRRECSNIMNTIISHIITSSVIENISPYFNWDN